MKHTKVFVKLLLLISHLSHAAIVIQGNDDAAPKGFTKPVSAEVFNRKTGIFFVGLENGAEEYALSKATRPDFKSPPKFTGIATQMNPTVAAYDNYVEFLSLLPQDDSRSVLAYVLDADNTDTLLDTANIVHVVLDDGNGDIASAGLNDANEELTAGIVRIASNSAYIFAAVRPNSANFGSPNSGIALVNMTRTGNTLTLNIKDAQTGLDGNRARKLDANNTEVKGDSGGAAVTFSSNIADENMVALYWDPVLERLYIGLRIQSGGAGTDIAKAVVAAQLVSGRLDLIPIVDDAALSAAFNQIVVTQGANSDVSIKHIRVMHNSTGPSYLIVNGGKGVTSAVGNKVFALPLVDKGDPDDPEQGTLANISAFNTTTFKFDTPALLPAQLALSVDPPAIVGACDLPIEADRDVIDMVVIDDAVYVSIAGEPDDDNDAGIFFSQALFDDEGKIVRWTPWKRAVSKNAFPGIKLPGSATHDGAVTFFEVDARTGNITLVEGTTERTVGITSWTTKSGNANGLITTLNKVLSKGSYSFLDLDQSIAEFLNNTVHRYALFGGVDKVVFARTAQATSAMCDSPQEVFTDFDATDTSENFLCTDLPSPGGCVQTLEFSCSSTGYFFAGTENGLFVFNLAGDAFNPNTLAELDNPPFSSGVWTHIDEIEGSVIDIKTSGLSLYVLTTKNQTQLAQSCDNPLEGTLYNIDFTNGDNIVDSFDAANISPIAVSGTLPGLNDTILFSKIRIISTGDSTSSAAADKEQLVLATNQGLFKSNADQAGANIGIPAATTQTLADWQVISNTDKTMFNFIGGINTPIQHTIWPVSVEDEKGCLIFDRAAVHQLSSADDELNTVNTPPFVPGSSTLQPVCSAFNAKGSPAAFTTFDPITHFWSDGARRFFIFNRTFDAPDETKLGVNPFNIHEWNVTSPQILSYPTLKTIKRFYWVEIIGSNGLIMAGTEKGVVGLE